MTLVIAERKNNKISFCSDSRISFGNQGHIDFGIKVFSIPVKIYSPTDTSTRRQTLDYDYKIGLAVIGSAMNAYLIKESIYEILQNLQYAPNWSNISMEKIADIVFKIYKKTTSDLTQILLKNGVCELLLGGYCPEKNKIKVFHYSLEILEDRTIPKFEEILENDNSILFYGSGKKSAEIVYNQNKNTIPLKILREIVKDENITSVGGGLQYGAFENRNFNIFGIEDYSLNRNGSFKEYLLTLRGITLYKGEFEIDMNDFHISYNFLRPFADEINQAFDIKPE
ncbi:hypothetical protein VP395_13865 [Mariniflexile soesokkakense]|uniref:Uncharacterized protein n=1 Tax=Mariniflexile soesokkakense TaxID=1343160 RepID=A0ABV0AG04_9FLAO